MLKMEKSHFAKVSWILGASLQLSSCTTLPQIRSGDYMPRDLLRFACSPGEDVKSAQGRILAKMSSPSRSGQFQAGVTVDSGRHLELDVTNPLGGTQAMIRVNEGRYEVIDYSDQHPVREFGQDYWGGIPLKWASTIFLGRIPCPETTPATRLEVSPAGELVVTWFDAKAKETQQFTYGFIQWRGKPWPASLLWTRDGSHSSRVEFQFESPETDTGSPEKWEAKSVQGQIKIKWRTRQISRD